MFGAGLGTGYSGGMNMGLGGHHGYAFNRWGNMGMDYTTMPGYCTIDYSNGWNTDYHDQLLRSNIDAVYQRYDRNCSGQLEGNEFFFAYRDLCLMMGLAPPQNYQSIWNAALACDSNRDGRVNKMEMFMLFKRIQGINAGYMY